VAKALLVQQKCGGHLEEVTFLSFLFESGCEDTT